MRYPHSPHTDSDFLVPQSWGEVTNFYISILWRHALLYVPAALIFGLIFLLARGFDPVALDAMSKEQQDVTLKSLTDGIDIWFTFLYFATSILALFWAIKKKWKLETIDKTQSLKLWWSWHWRFALAYFGLLLVFGFIVAFVLTLAGQAEDQVKEIVTLLAYVFLVPIGIWTLKMTFKKWREKDYVAS
jgi:hypothetical protein